jgi:hypothetical protein
VAVAVLLSVAACNGGDESEAGPTATVPPAPTSTTTTNPYAVPEVIDAAYVNRVLEGLDAVVGDIVRLVIATRDIPPEAVDRVKAVFLDREGQNLELASLSHSLRDGFRGFRENPGNKRSIVKNLMAATPACVFVQVERDYSQVGLQKNAKPSTEWIVLKPLDPAQDPASYNPTPWAFAAEGVEPPPRPC